jgi:tetratricopeptide (TPR) repeat protein
MAATARDERSIAATKAQALRLEGLRLVTGGNYRAATRAYRRAVEIARRCDPPEHLLLPTVLNDFGVLCKFTGKFASAERMYRQALKLVSRHGSDRTEFLATLYHNLGGLEHARGRYVRGLGYARRGVALRKKLRPRNRLAIVADEAALAAILADMERAGEASAIYRRVLRFYNRVLGGQHYEVGAAWANLGALYWKAGQLDVAERALRHAVSILERAAGRNHPRIASALNNLAVVCARRGKLREAGALYRRVLGVLERQSGSTYPPISLVKQNYAKLRKSAQRQ